MTQFKFKSFLWKNLKESKAYVNNLKSKFKHDLHFQFEFVLKQASHLKHLQFILSEFDIDGALGEPTISRYFQKELKPSVQAKMEQCGRKLDSFQDMVQKTVNAKAKSSFQPCFSACKTDQHCPQDIRPANSTTAKSQRSLMKNPRVKEFKTQTQKATLSCYSKSIESSKKDWKEKKKK